MNIINDLKVHFKFHLSDAKFEKLFQFYTIAMCLTLLLHLGMGVIPSPNHVVNSLNNVTAWALVSIILFSILSWNLNNRFPHIIKIVNIAYIIGFIFALIATAATYISFLISPTLIDLLVKLIPVILATTIILLLYKFEYKVEHNVNSGIPVVVLLTIVVAYSKDLGLYLVAYFALPIAMIWNMYIASTLFILKMKCLNKKPN